MNTDKIPTLIINTLLHILALLIFISLFYWNVAKIKEYNTLRSMLIGSEGTITGLLNSDMIMNIKNLRYLNNINEIKSEKYNELMNYVDHFNDQIIKNNQEYKRYNYILVSIYIFILFSTIIYFNYKKYKINYLACLYENIILIMIIGFIEYLFFTFVATKYIPIDKNELNDLIIDIINDI